MQEISALSLTLDSHLETISRERDEADWTSYIEVALFKHIFVLILILIVSVASAWLIPKEFETKLGIIGSVASVLSVVYAIYQIALTQTAVRAAETAATNAQFTFRRESRRIALGRFSDLLAEIQELLADKKWDQVADRVRRAANLALELAVMAPPGKIDEKWQELAQNLRDWHLRFARDQSPGIAWTKLFDRVHDKVIKELSEINSQ